ncbi:MAG: sigma 54-interacting transcriptional regulator [Planctomycetota bacterium]|nr:sigma 54-interacting transcriptional regulator [Planctomycetota bacterium]
MPYIRIISGPQTGQEAYLQGPLTVGRDEASGLCLWDESASRYHCEIYNDSGWKIRDLGSRNGLEINGRRANEARLKDGDRIQLGSTTLRFGEATPGRKETVLITSDTPLDVDGRQSMETNAGDGTALGVARDLSEILELPLLLDEALEQVVRKVPFDRGTIVLGTEFGLSASKHSARCKGEAQKIRISTTIVEQAMERGEALRLSRGDERAATSESVVEVGIASAICCPLRHGDKDIGFFYLDRLKGSNPFQEKELAFATEVCRSLSIQVINAHRFAAARQEIARHTEREIIGKSAAIQEIHQQIRQLATSDAATLITGETGTGKELVARALHRQSKRVKGPFIPVNCGALPESIIESELFGHEKGAFTGALSRRPGRFELAGGGVLFLDEIGELPLSCQVTFLRILDDGEFYPIGATKPLQADVRVVAATNRDLDKETEEKNFREDLLFRLKVLTIHLPPLRERVEDIPPLARHFLEKASLKARRRGMTLSDEAIETLQRYSWPGNVRELQNVIERAALLSTTKELGPEVLPKEMRREKATAGPVLSLAEAEKIAVTRALDHVEWKKGAAAKLLGVSWPTLNKKIKDYGITPPGS